MARQIVVELVGDNKKLIKSLDQATSRTGKFNGVLKGMAVGAGIAGFNLVTDAIGGVIGKAQEAITNASNLQQSVGAVESVFGATSKTIFAFGDTAAQSMGLSKREVNEMASVVGAQLKGMGFSTDEAAERYKALQTRAADVAATFGGKTSDAIEAVSALLRGETDPIERYGVSIKQADINARILALGLDTSTAAAKKNAQSVAAMDLFMQQTKDTTGQFAREQDSVAGSSQIMDAKIENLSAKFGSLFLPVLATVIGFINDTVLPAVEDFINWIGSLGLSFESVTPIIQSIMPVFQTVFGTIQTIVSDVVTIVTGIWHVFGDDIKQYIGIVLGIVGDLFKHTFEIIQGVFDVFAGIFSGDWSKVWNGIQEILKGALGLIFDLIKGVLFKLVPFIIGEFAKLPGAIWNVIVSIPGKIAEIWHRVMNDPNIRKGLFDTLTAPFRLIIDFFKGLPGKVGDIFRDVWNSIPKAFKGAINQVIGWWNGLKFGIPRITLPNPLGGNIIDVGGGYAHTPQIPYLHQGGIVPGVPGSDVPAILQAGERVIPRSGGGGEIHIHIDSFIGTDRDIDRLAERVARRMLVAGA